MAWYVRGWELEQCEPDVTYACHACGEILDLYDASCPGCGAEFEWQDDDPDIDCWQDEEPVYRRTGRLVCSMVGDDAHHLIDPDDIEPLDREEYCSVCGQLGCQHDGYDRSA